MGEMSNNMTDNDRFFSYTLRPKSELFWFIAVAAITVGVQALVEFDPSTITDWESWAIGIGAAMVRAAAGAFLAYITKHGWTYEDE